MRMNRHPRRLAALAIPLAGAVLLSGTDRSGRLPSAYAQQGSAGPQHLQLTQAERETILRDMRTMMRSLSLVLHGIADGNMSLMEQAARTSGKALALNPELEKKLPVPYVQLDQKVHMRFDQLADSLKGGAAQDKVVTRLAAISGYCVACHEMYRLDQTR
jgi:hypothetical protein